MPLVQQSNNAADRSLGDAASFGLPAASMLLLDSLLTRGVTSARSLRRLTAAARGSCVQVRRIADSVQALVGFDAAGKVSMTSPVQPIAGGAATTLGAFHQGGSVSVVEHFDQSPRNGRAVLVPAASEPLLIANGSFIANDGSPALIAYDKVDDWSEWPILLGPPHTVIVSGSMADSADAGAAFQVDGAAIGAPAASAAAIIPGNPGRMAYSGKSIGDGVSDRGRYRTMIAVFDGIASALYSNGALVASGDAGATRASSLLVGRNAPGAHSNASYHTLVTLNRALSAAEAAAVSTLIAGWA